MRPVTEPDLRRLIWYLCGSRVVHRDPQTHTPTYVERIDHDDGPAARQTYEAIRAIIERHQAQLLVQVRRIDRQVVVELHDRWMCLAIGERGVVVAYAVTPTDPPPTQVRVLPKNQSYAALLRHHLRPAPQPLIGRTTPVEAITY